MPTTAKLYFGANRLGGGVEIAEISGGTTVEYTDGTATWRHHEIRTGGTLTVVTAGYVETLLLLAGGGGGNGGNSGYPGGGGGAGGAFFRQWAWLEPQTIIATIGGGGSGGSGYGYAGDGGDSTAIIAGYGNTPGSTITCGGGKGAGGQNGTIQNGRSGSNGGGNGGACGRGSSPGVSVTAGSNTLDNFYLQRTGTDYAYGVAGSTGQPYRGRGGNTASNSAGGAGVFLVRYPVIAV